MALERRLLVGAILLLVVLMPTARRLSGRQPAETPAIEPSGP
jgi:hypothetical protein